MNLMLDLPAFVLRALRPRRAWSRSTPARDSLMARTDFQVRYSNPAGLWTSPRLSQMVEVQGARMIYLSGQTAADAKYKVHSREFRQQAHAVYDNIELALRSVGATLQNVVKTTTYLTDAGDIPALREVRLERYKELQTPPANTLLVVSRLAEPEFVIEIDVVAALPAVRP
jgi:enamine deaminase RidA (YjgF/YER057c/UK114 family)